MNWNTLQAGLKKVVCVDWENQLQINFVNLKIFQEEYLAHINGKCPSGKCQSLIKYQINDLCIGCTKCAQKCPTEAILFKPHENTKLLLIFVSSAMPAGSLPGGCGGDRLSYGLRSRRFENWLLSIGYFDPSSSPE